MALQEKISEDLRKAMKACDQLRRLTLSMLKSALHNRAIEKGKQAEGLSDEEAIEVVLSEAKKRKDAALEYEKGGRPELAQKEKDELKILAEYLPRQLSPEEVRAEIEKVIAEFGVSQKENFGRLMAEAMKRLKGQADGNLVKEELEKLLK